MDNEQDFHKGAAKAHLILARQYWLNKDEEEAKRHAMRAKEEIKKAQAIEAKYKEINDYMEQGESNE